MIKPINPISRLLTVICITCSSGANSQENSLPFWELSTPTNSNTAYVKLQPRICVVETQGQACHKMITVQLALPRKTNVCLYQQHKQLPVWCQDNAQFEQFRIDINSSSDVTLTLLEQDSGNVISTAKVLVNLYQPAPQRRKRRYGLGVM